MAGLYVASFLLIAGFMRYGRPHRVVEIAAHELSSLRSIMFVTFDVAFDVIMPKGPLEAVFGVRSSASRAMEAFGLLLHGFGVLLTWKILALMMVGLVLGIFVGVLPAWAGRTASPSCCRSLSRWIRPPPS